MMKLNSSKWDGVWKVKKNAIYSISNSNASSNKCAAGISFPGD